MALPLESFRAFGNFIDSHPKTFPFLGKKQHVLMIGSHKKIFKKSSFRVCRGLLPYSPSILSFIFDKRSSFYITCMRNCNDHFIIGNHILHTKVPPAYSILERRSSPYLSLIYNSSRIMISILRSFLSRMSLRSVMVLSKLIVFILKFVLF